MTRARVDARNVVAAEVAPPLSKSDAQRSLVLRHALAAPQLAAFFDEADRATFSEDIQAVAEGLERLRSSDSHVDISCGDGGAPFRFLLTQAAIAFGKTVTLRGSIRLGERPHTPLFESLEASLGPCGLRLTHGNPWPLVVHAPTSTRAPLFRISGRESSQYASSLLLGAAHLCRTERRPWRVELTTPIASRGYLSMTVVWLRACGVSVDESDHAYEMRFDALPVQTPRVPGDWSSLGYLLLAAWKSASRVAHVDVEADHPDRAMVGFLADVGIGVAVSSEHVATVEGVASRGLRASALECPDLMPTLAALACVLPAASRFEAVGILRHKESDRLEGMRALVTAVGGETLLEGETLIVHPPQNTIRSFVADACGDHRMAMSAVTLAVLAGAELELTGAECVKKSFPGFFDQMRAIGVTYEQLSSD